LQLENKTLKKGLSPKEKALAESAALLILPNKENRLWGMRTTHNERASTGNYQYSKNEAGIKNSNLRFLPGK
jgi:hypothetical protein